MLYLNAPALEVLAGLPRMEGNPHVIPGKSERRRLLAGSIRFGSVFVLRQGFEACASMTYGILLLRWASLAG